MSQVPPKISVGNSLSACVTFWLDSVKKSVLSTYSSKFSIASSSNFVSLIETSVSDFFRWGFCIAWGNWTVSFDLSDVYFLFFPFLLSMYT